MSLIDKAVAAITPPESDKARKQARSKAKTEAASNSWFAMIILHHEAIEQAFEAVKKAATARSRRTAQKKLAVLLTGHSIAEEAVIYPAMASHSQKAHAELAYQEQSAAKGETAALEELDPMSEDFIDKLEHIRGAVAHHVFEEESKWFPKLQEEADEETMERLTERYAEEFSRYMGDDAYKKLLADA